MLKIDQDALECDLAETYHIYNYKELSPSRVALFSCGLRENSRIKLKIMHSKYTFDQMLMIHLIDQISVLTWIHSGAKTNKKPKLLGEALFGQGQNEKSATFVDGKTFDEEWKKLSKRGGQS